MTLNRVPAGFWTSLPKKKSSERCVAAFPEDFYALLKSLLKTSLPSDNVEVYNCTYAVSRNFLKMRQNIPGNTQFINKRREKKESRDLTQPLK